MAVGYVLYNSMAGSGETDAVIKRMKGFFGGELRFIDVIDNHDPRRMIAGMSSGDYIVICGGDGTLNNFINDTRGLEYPGEVYYYPNGNGNDFAREMGREKGSDPFPVSEYICKLPCVSVNGREYRFVNGVGYGIDGYCCETGDALKKKGKKKINYAGIAVKGLLFFYKSTSAKVTVDGVCREYKHVWLAPTMFGKYYGGGMMPAPEQKRESDVLSVMVYRGRSKLKALMAFPGIFTGEHIKHTDMVEVRSGREITVEFDRPSPLQIDGETILGVTSYTALCPSAAEAVEAKAV